MKEKGSWKFAERAESSVRGYDGVGRARSSRAEKGKIAGSRVSQRKKKNKQWGGGKSKGKI